MKGGMNQLANSKKEEEILSRRVQTKLIQRKYEIHEYLAKRRCCHLIEEKHQISLTKKSKLTYNSLISLRKEK